MHRSILLPLLLSACIETTLNPEDKDPQPGLDSEPIDCPPQIPDCWDTADSAIESLPWDTVDTSPQDCEVELGEPGTVVVDEACVGTEAPEVTDPWNVKIEWQGPKESAYHMGLIANLTDDNGDGDVDEDDVPDIVYISTAGRLVVLDGATGSEHWGKSGYQGYAIGTLADVDSDGVTDILTISSGGPIVALDANGTTMWTSTERSTVTHDLLAVADLDADGNPEVLSNQYVLNGQTGALKWKATMTGSIPYHGPIAADLDQDGDQEVIIQNVVYDTNGTQLWSSPIMGSYGHWSLVLQADSDKEAEVVMVGQGQLGLYEHDGTLIHKVSAGTTQPGPPCAGDFDGDGEAEIAWPSSSNFNAYELDGTLLWTYRIDDSSGLAGCSGYDIDGDSVLEILYADQGTFYIYDGATGTVRYQNNDHASGTIFEYPTVADVDNDGSAEIVIASNYGGVLDGITVFGHDGDGWPKSGTTWHVHDFAVTNINSDGSVPKVPDASWLKYNVFRARPAVDDPATADLAMAITGYCVAECEEEGKVRVALQAWNDGGAVIPAGTPWALYAIDNEDRLVATGVLPEIGSGEKPTGFEIELTAADWGRGGLRLVADDDGTGSGDVGECDESNNIDELYDVPCGW